MSGMILQPKFAKCITAIARLKIFMVIQAPKNANHLPMKALMLWLYRGCRLNIKPDARALALSKAAACRIIDCQRSDGHKSSARTWRKTGHIIKKDPSRGKFGA